MPSVDSIVTARMSESALLRLENIFSSTARSAKELL